MTRFERMMERLGWVRAKRLSAAERTIAVQKQDLDDARKPWTHVVRVSDELVEQLRAEWSEPVRVRIATRARGFYEDELELVFQTVDRADYPSGIIITTDYHRGTPCS